MWDAIAIDIVRLIACLTLSYKYFCNDLDTFILCIENILFIKDTEGLERDAFRNKLRYKLKSAAFRAIDGEGNLVGQSTENNKRSYTPWNLLRPCHTQGTQF